MRKIRYKDIERFDGGFVDANSLDIGSESLNMIRYASNIRQRSGSAVPRDGHKVKCDFTLVAGITNALQAVYEYKREQDVLGVYSLYRAIVFSTGNDIYYVETSNPNVAVKMNSVAMNNDIYCANAFDHLFIGDGAHAMRAWNGNDLYHTMFAAPTVALSCIQSPGAITGYRKYKYTFYTPSGGTYPYAKESNASAVMQIQYTGGQRGTITMQSPFPDSQITMYRLYATEVGPNPDLLVDYNLMTTQASNVYVDNYPTFTGDAFSDTDRGVPDTYKYLLFDGSRLWGAYTEEHKNEIGWSLNGNPFYWPAANYERIGIDDGDFITGLGMIANIRYIFKEHSIWEWTGNPDVATEIVPVARPDASQNMTRLAVGCKDSRTLTQWGNSLIFRSSDGHVYMLTTDSITQLSRYIGSQITLLDWGAKACVHNDYYIISSGLLTLVCDLRKGVFGWQGYDTGVYPNCFCITNDNYCIGTEGEKIVQYYDPTEYQDYGEDFTKEIQPCFLRVGGGNTQSLFRSIIIDSPNRGEDITVEVHNENGVIGAASSLTYEDTDSICYIPRGARGVFMSAILSWTEKVNIIGVSYGYQPVRRH